MKQTQGVTTMVRHAAHSAASFSSPRIARLVLSLILTFTATAKLWTGGATTRESLWGFANNGMAIGELMVVVGLWSSRTIVMASMAAISICFVGGVLLLSGQYKKCGCMGSMEVNPTAHAILASICGICAVVTLRGKNRVCRSLP